jgi:capsular polysaccharide biosynthesis protein
VPFSFTHPKQETDVVFHVSCNALSPKDSYILMNAFTAIINERSEKVLNDVFVIDVSTEAKMGHLVSPNIVRNTVIAAFLGALIPFIFVLLRTAFDTRITKEEDLKEKFAYPVLGQIPHI